VRRHLGRDARHQVFERRVDDVRLERPDDLVAGRLLSLLVRPDGGHQRREARVGDDHEALVRVGLTRLLHQERLAHRVAVGELRRVERVFRRGEEEGVARETSDLAHARDVAHRALRLGQKALDHQRRQVVLQHHVLEIAL
jgi:hypothetical protein